MAFASFYQRFVSLIKYLKLTNRLEERFEDATAEELVEAHECLICREGMDRGKKLPCKHVFHLDCLRMWLQHQQTCPLCRFLLTIHETKHLIFFIGLRFQLSLSQPQLKMPHSRRTISR
jgi:hypothetical protein